MPESAFRPKQQGTSRPEDDLLWRHLKTVPAFRALLRAVETRFYQQLTLAEPILDLGCGDGHLASMAFDAPLAVGVDPWWGPLQKARRAQTHELLICGNGHLMPFAKDYFASVISNSVLEHIPNVQAVLQETNRILRPDGLFVFTTTSHLFEQNLAGAKLLERLRLRPAADAYRRLFSFISRCAHNDTPERWGQRLAMAGFGIERWQYYFSSSALRALEIGHLQGLPAACLHALTGHWILAPWRSNLAWVEQWLRPLYEEPYPSEGAMLLFVARKAADHSIPGRLPESRPFD
ncbi:MAG: class I SAM-dependent methyltransferase [Candidatus Promineifilaceae bacterium]|nr:class I SAM-dependent methyltransferase [Candidatus Promineifilaceae bacterium]